MFPPKRGEGENIGNSPSFKPYYAQPKAPLPPGTIVTGEEDAPPPKVRIRHH